MQSISILRINQTIITSLLHQPPRNIKMIQRLYRRVKQHYISEYRDIIKAAEPFLSLCFSHSLLWRKRQGYSCCSDSGIVIWRKPKLWIKHYLCLIICVETEMIPLIVTYQRKVCCYFTKWCINERKTQRFTLQDHKNTTGRRDRIFLHAPIRKSNILRVCICYLHWNICYMVIYHFHIHTFSGWMNIKV